ncbi:unnamed protein product, partial [Choristocarpus tenellus]
MRKPALIPCATTMATSLRWSHAFPASLLRMHSTSPPSVPLFYNDVYKVELPGNHRFPMQKYRMVRERELGRRRTKATSPPQQHVEVSFAVSPL